MQAEKYEFVACKLDSTNLIYRKSLHK